MKYPKQRDDVSYGVPADWKPDADSATSVIGNTVFFLKPTPGAPNGSVLNGTVAKLAFSQPHGLYDEPFDLTISTETPGVTLRYTTDGSVPTIDSGTVLEGGLLKMEKTTVLRVAGFKPGFKPTKVVTRTYLFPKDIVGSRRTGCRPTVSRTSGDSITWTTGWISVWSMTSVTRIKFLTGCVRFRVTRGDGDGRPVRRGVRHFCQRKKRWS